MTQIALGPYSGAAPFVRESPGAGANFEIYGTVNVRGTGSLSINVRGRFGSA